MAISFRLPTINADSATLLNTPVAGTDVVLDGGVLTILDESGAESLVLKASDLINYNYAATSNGIANVVDVDLSGVVIVNNGVYSLTISAPYAVNFFGGGQETNSIFQTRTYTVSLDATATVVELRNAFVARINDDVNNYFSAAGLPGGVVRVTADAAGFGPLTITAPALSVVSDNVAWVSPVGTTNEVLQYVPNAALVSGTYDRFIITHRKFQRSNIVNGLQVVRPVQSIVYLNSADGGTVATVAKLTKILDGDESPVSGYLGCPAV